jgi:hypothetical protein
MAFRLSYGLTVLLLFAATTAFSLVSGGSLIQGFFYSLILLISERLTGLTAYGCRADSRIWFTGIFLALSPEMIASDQDLTGRFSDLFLVFLALYSTVKLLDKGDERWILMLLPTGTAAIIGDIRLAGLLLPVSAQLILINTGKRTLRRALIVVLPLLLFMTAVILSGGRLRELIDSWDLVNFTGVGQLPAGTDVPPGWLYIMYPLAHPWFCVLLPGLLLLFRKTDLVNPARRMLLGGAVFYLLVLGGLRGREMFPLLPVYIILLVSIFPSWDRVYCYGLYFFRKTVWLTIGILILTQVAMIVYRNINQVQL